MMKIPGPHDYDQPIDSIARALARARRVLFITGAGISAESGLPTYRGFGGLYNDTMTEEGIPIETALAGSTLHARPEVTWKYLARIEQACRGAAHNRAHELIAQFERTINEVWVLTQNIDGFHQTAGSRNLIDIHGDMHLLVCPACGWKDRVCDYSALRIPPQCPRCEKIVRPDVVFFGESLPEDKYLTLMNELETGFDMYFSVGTTSVFPYIQAPIVDARRRGLLSVEINPERTDVSSMVDIILPMKAVSALEKINAAYQSLEPSP